jgi:hypothetical protein
MIARKRQGSLEEPSSSSSAVVLEVLQENWVLDSLLAKFAKIQAGGLRY